MPNVKATKVLQKRVDSAIDSFHKCYVSIWDEERWQTKLFPALGESTRYCALINQFILSGDDFLSTLDLAEVDIGKFPALEPEMRAQNAQVSWPIIATRQSQEAFPVPQLSRLTGRGKQLFSHWNMDLASVLAACVLQVQPGDSVLDLCAAPGGKSIVLAQMLWPELHAGALPDSVSQGSISAQSVLHSNENDLNRHKRLASNLQSYLPPSLFADRVVQVIRLDGSDKSAVQDLPLGEGGYDKVLLDAPCSSERHIIHAYLQANRAGAIAEDIANWKASHSKMLAKTQAALLMTALKAVKIGGTVLYATCSIATEQNDGVIERALQAVTRDRKKSISSARQQWKVKVDDGLQNDVALKEILEKMTETTKYGCIALPDHPAGGKWGPLYFCRLRKDVYVSTRAEPPQEPQEAD